MNEKIKWIKKSENKYECPICHKMVDKVDENTYCPNCGFAENLNHKLQGTATRMINREKPSDRYLYDFEVGRFFGYAGLNEDETFESVGFFETRKEAETKAKEINGIVIDRSFVNRT